LLDDDAISHLISSHLMISISEYAEQQQGIVRQYVIIDSPVFNLLVVTIGTLNIRFVVSNLTRWLM